MKIGIVCPYSFDVPGGVQAHVAELAEVLIQRGHRVSVLAPASDETQLPDFVVSTGKALSFPYNGSVARLAFGPVTYTRIRAWIEKGEFDVLHIHEPNAPSLSMLSLKIADGPIVATFHASTTKSLLLSTFQGVLRPYHEKIAGRIAVSELARRWQVEALGSDAVEIPNGVHVPAFATAAPLQNYPRPGRTLLFIGRYDEPRKGMQTLLAALPSVAAQFPDIEVLVVGRGDEEKLRRDAGVLAKHFRFLGQTTDAEKASALRSADIYCAPNTGGESFGIVLVEAMAAGAPVVASNLDAFRRVLRDGKAGALFPVGDSEALADQLVRVLSDDDERARLVSEGSRAAVSYDWPVVAEQIVRVYETVAVPGRTVKVVD
ncbi:MAG: glycosyltransferase family 4 protein [Rhodococcus sp. (in: high G+C Gram-positive bacteria)]